MTSYDDTARATTHAEESVSEAPNPSICWYLVDSLTVITRPVFEPPLVKRTADCGCNNFARSPVVSTTCTFGPGGPDGVTNVFPPEQE